MNHTNRNMLVHSQNRKSYNNVQNKDDNTVSTSLPAWPSTKESMLNGNEIYHGLITRAAADELHGGFCPHDMWCVMLQTRRR